MPVNQMPIRARRTAFISCFPIALTALAAPARAQQTRPVPAPQRPAPAASDALARVNEAMDALTKKVWPSVVQIQVTSYGAQERGGGRDDTSVIVGRQRSVGSG